MPEPDLIRIQLLGPLAVVREDGTTVSIGEWRTGRTRDLLRLLALADGRPVRPTELVEKLWPDVEDHRRRNSLRTAASQIRRTLRTTRLTRRPDGLVLTGCWVDVLQVLDDARRAQEAARVQHHEQVVQLAQRAEDLCRSDFQAYDDDADWARSVRQDLLRERQEMLVDAAGSAMALHLFRESLDFATTAVRLDPTSEGAHRALMRAHAERGEVATALRVFEAHRVHLAEELGTGPSAETRELHARLLRDLGD